MKLSILQKTRAMFHLFLLAIRYRFNFLSIQGRLDQEVKSSTKQLNLATKHLDNISYIKKFNSLAKAEPTTDEVRPLSEAITLLRKNL